MNAIIIKRLVLGLFLVCISKISAQSSCCKTIKAGLERKWQAYKTLCSIHRFGHCSKYALLFKGNNIADYVIKKGAPSMTAFTACFWVKTSQTKGYGHYITYAVPGHANDILISNQNDLRLVVDQMNPNVGKYYSSSHNISINDGKWHHICVTWKSQGGHCEIYKDGKIAMKETLSGSAGLTLRGGGTWVLGQDQDTVGGSFDANQAFQGEMTEVNIWDQVLSSKEVLKMSESCQSIRVGNVQSWNDFKSGVKGNVKTVKPTCCLMFDI